MSIEPPAYYPSPANGHAQPAIRLVSHNAFWFQDSSFALDAPPAPRADVLEQLCALYRKLRADVLCLQEVQSEITAQKIAGLLEMEYLFRAGGGHSQYGGAVFSRWPMQEMSFPGEFVPDRVLLRVQVRPETARPLRLVNVHLPSHRQLGVEAGRRQRLKELALVAGEADLLLGDFNEKPEGPCASFLRQCDYADVARVCSAGNTRNNLARPPGFRGDHIWLSQKRTKELLGYFYVPRRRLALRGTAQTFLSDHLPIGCELTAL